MTKPEAINRVSEETGITKEECSLIIDTFLNKITDALCIGDKVILRNFATFEIKDRTAQYHRDPVTNEVRHFPPVRVVQCRMSENIKNMINKRY